MAPPGAYSTGPALARTKSAGEKAMRLDRRRATTSARSIGKAKDEVSVADAEAEALAAAQSAALEQLVAVDMRPIELPQPQDTNFTVEDESSISTLQSMLQVTVVSEIHGDDEMICYASESFLQMIGHTHDDVISHNLTSVLIGTGDDDNAELLRTLLKSGELKTQEVQCVRKDGSHFANQITVVPIAGMDGEIEKRVSFHHVAQETDSRGRTPMPSERLSSVFLGSIFTAAESMEATIEAVSPVLEESMGYDQGSLEDKSMLILAGPETAKSAKETLLMNHMDHKVSCVKILLYKSDGQPMWALACLFPLSHSTGPSTGRSLIRRRDVSIGSKHTNIRDNPGRPAGKAPPVNVDEHVTLLFDVTRQHLKKIGKWTMGKVIGKGAQGVVRLGKDPSGEILAIKMVDASNFRNIGDIDRVQEEIDVLCKLKHKNIIRLVDTCFINNVFYFAMEWASGGPLVDYIYRQPDRRMDEEDAREIFHQITAALDYCHRRRIVHRDLKPENVLLDENNVVKIADFGLAAITAPFNEGLTLMCGTPEFTAPEIVSGKEYDGASVDIWSLGVMLFEFISGYLPFKARDQKELFRKIVKGDARALPDTASVEVQVLVAGMLQVKVEKRLSLDEIMAHPWMLGKGNSKPSGSESPPEPRRTNSNASTDTQKSLRLVVPDNMLTSSPLDTSSSKLELPPVKPGQEEEAEKQEESVASPTRAASIRVSTRPSRQGAGRRGDAPPGGISSPYAVGGQRGKSKAGFGTTRARTGH